MNQAVSRFRSFTLHARGLVAELFKERTENADHLDYLDGWRGLAIALVLWEHFFSSALIDTGEMGVDIFFVLSGMLMSNILFVKRAPLGTFYRRRISRIVPALFSYLFFVFFIDTLARHHVDWKEVLSTASFLRTYYPTIPGIWEVDLPLGHLWSLNIEEHSYVLMSLLVMIPFLRNREWFALGVIGSASIAIYLLYYHYPSLAPHNFEIRTESQTSYIMLSAGYFLIRKKFAPYIRPWLVVIAFSSIVLFFVHGESGWRYLISPILLAFTVNHLGDAPAAMRRALSMRPLRYLGKWSYSIYLWQQPFAQFRSHHHLGSAIVMVALFLGISSFYLIEDPMREWLNSKWK